MGSFESFPVKRECADSEALFLLDSRIGSLERSLATQRNNVLAALQRVEQLELRVQQIEQDVAALILQPQRKEARIVSKEEFDETLHGKDYEERLLNAFQSQVPRG